MEPGQTTVFLFKNSVPEFVEAELAALYEHVFSSLPQLSICGSIGAGTHTYVAQHYGKTNTVLLFHIDSNKVQVLNEQIAIDAAEVSRFARYVFDTFPMVDVVCFRAVQSDLRNFPYPYQQFYRTEDIVLRLPRSANEYLGSLGKRTRRNIKYYSNRLKRQYPMLGYVIDRDADIDERHVRAIVELNRARMALKNKTSRMDEAEIERLVSLVKQGGLTCVMMVDGRVIAGTVCSRVGANYFLHMVAHDPAYDDASIGTLCCYLTITDCIVQGGKEFHFLWGRFDYKYLLLGVKQDFDELVIYRSPVRMLLNIRTVLTTAWNGRARTWKFRLLEMADCPDDGNFASRFAFRALNALRGLKRFITGFMARRR